MQTLPTAAHRAMEVFGNGNLDISLALILSGTVGS